MLFLIWTVSVVVATPTLLYSTTVLYSRTDTTMERSEVVSLINLS